MIIRKLCVRPICLNITEYVWSKLLQIPSLESSLACIHLLIRVCFTYRVDWLLQIIQIVTFNCLGDQSLLILAIDETVSSTISLDLIKLLKLGLQLDNDRIMLDYLKFLFLCSLLFFFCFLFFFPLTHLSMVLPQTILLTIIFGDVSHSKHRASKESPKRDQLCKSEEKTQLLITPWRFCILVGKPCISYYSS